MNLENIDKQLEEIKPKVKTLEIKSIEGYRVAADMILLVKNLEKEIEDKLDPLIKNAHKTHKDLVSFKKSEILKVLATKEEISKKMLEYEKKQEAIRKEEQRKADAERARIEAEKKAELDNLAEQELEKGRVDKAEVLLARAEDVFVPPTVIAPSIQKTEKSNLGSVTTVDDIEVYVSSQRGVVEGVWTKVFPPDVLRVDLGALKRWAKSNDIKLYENYGVTIVSTKRLVTRGN